MDNKRNIRRRENYNRLRTVGFTAEQANKLKNRSRKTISKIVTRAKDILPTARDTMDKIVKEALNE